MKNYLLLLLIGFSLASCQEVITVNLNSVSPKLVVEGNINNRPGPYTIHLSRTTNYFNAAGVNPATGALVLLSDNTGHTDTLHENAPGAYVTGTISGVPGRTYTLFISSGGQKFTAVSTMPDTLAIDSLSYSLRQPRPGSGGVPTYVITCSFTDPATLGNHYGFRLYSNGILKNNLVDNRVVDDKLINGNAQHFRLRSDTLAAGDTARVDLICLDKAGYDYYNTLKSTLSAGGPFSAPPANPISNISNGGIGYFGAFAYTTRSVLLQ